MKQLKTFLLSLILVTLFMQVKAQVSPLDKALNNVADSYSGIKSALAANDGVAAENKAKELIKALNKKS
jgi:outer membrane lipoprotein-sorting protein